MKQNRAVSIALGVIDTAHVDFSMILLLESHHVGKCKSAGCVVLFTMVNNAFQPGEYFISARWLLEATMLTIYITLLVYGNLCSCAVALHYVNACCGHSERSLAVDLGVAYQGTARSIDISLGWCS